jgi:hypothetical protein
VLLPVLAGVEGEATGVDATDSTGELEAAAALETGAVTLVAEEATEPVAKAGELEVGETVMKTPPEADAAEDCAGADVGLAGPAAEVATEAGPAVAEGPKTGLPQAVPVGMAVADVDAPFCSTESPGLGKRTSVES